MKYLKRVILQDKRLSLITFLCIVSIPFIIAFIASSTLNPWLRKQNQEILEGMRNSQSQPNPNQAILTEVTALTAGQKYQEAQQKIEQALETEGLQDSDKRALYATLSFVCLKNESLLCIDKVIEQYDGFIEVDYFFLNDAAVMAQQKGDEKRASRYYQRLFTEIENNGGQQYVDTLNENAVKQLDYGQIKKGAGK